jgi:hypothetical protein
LISPLIQLLQAIFVRSPYRFYAAIITLSLAAWIDRKDDCRVSKGVSLPGWLSKDGKRASYPGHLILGENEIA